MMLRPSRWCDPEGCRLIGLLSGEALIAPKGHSLLLSANGGGKTTRGAMPWLFSFLSSNTGAATLVLDSKNAEIGLQVIPMLKKMGIKVALIDDMGICEGLEEYRIALNPFGAVVSAFLRNPLDVLFAIETVTHVLVPEPENDHKNRYFRAWPRNLIEFAILVLLYRKPKTVTPGGVAALLSDPDMLVSFAEIEAEEGAPAVKALARAILGMRDHEHWPQHLEEATRALKIFSGGTRLHDVGRGAKLSHEDLIRQGYVIFLAGPQSYITRLGTYYALHIMAFCDALYQGAGGLRAICDEFTNTPLKSLVEALTTLRAFSGEIHMIAQSRSEIIRKFGEQETRTIEENAVVKQWLGFSSFEEAERVSKAMGEQHAVATSLGSDNGGFKTNTNLSLIKQRWMSPAELMAMPPSKQLIHMKGVGFILADTISQQNIDPYCDLIADNPLEGGRLPSDPKIRMAVPGGAA